MKLPHMIGAHAPKKPKVRARRDPLCEAARMVNRAFDDWTTKAGRSHLVYQRETFNGQPAPR